jgi:hypothetical protein
LISSVLLRYLEGFDFSTNPKLPAAQIRDLAALRWLQAGESIILYGAVGVGKTHVAQAMGHLAIRAGEVPRRSLLLVAGLAGVGLAAVALTGVGPEPLVLLTTGSFVAVYAFGTAAAVRLLPRRSLVRSLAAVALLAVAGLLLASGWYLLWPLAVTGGALLYLRYRGPRRTGPTPPARPEPVHALSNVRNAGVRRIQGIA